MPNRTFAVGDVHGHYTELMKLWSQLKKEAKLNPAKDTVVFLGDIVDGGPDTNTVISQLMLWQKKYKVVVLFGNHEDLMLDALGDGHVYHSWDLWWGQGGRATAYSYYLANATLYEKALMSPKDYIPEKHLDWLNALPRWYEDENYFFVHGGLVPGFSINDHKANPDLRQEMIWIRDQFIDSDYDWGKKVIYGHTTGPEPVVQANKIGIDTFGRFSGHLTAIELPAGKFYSEESKKDPAF